MGGSIWVRHYRSFGIYYLAQHGRQRWHQVTYSSHLHRYLLSYARYCLLVYKWPSLPRHWRCLADRIW